MKIKIEIELKGQILIIVEKLYNLGKPSFRVGEK